MLFNLIKNASIFSLAITASVIVHVFLLSIHFEPELKKFADKLPVLEVMLVNAKTKTRPDNTDNYAQANLDRGGNTNLDRVMKTALPSVSQQKTVFTLKPSNAAQSAAAAAKTNAPQTKEEKRVAALEKQAQELLTQINSPQKVETQTAQQERANQAQTANQPSPSQQQMDAIAAAALEMDRLEALISKQQDEYQKRPKRKFIGSRAKEYKYALYVDSWRQKVEKVGNSNYPAAAKELKLYGQLRMTVSIKSDGSIENIEINQSSGHKILDEAAKRIVKLGAPYAKFDDNIRKETDILSITRTWTFTKEDAIATE